MTEPRHDTTPVDFDPFAGGEILRAVPTTPPQQEIWTAARMGPDASCAFNESVTLRLGGPLDVDALRRALDDLVARHEALRACLTSDGQTLLVEPAAPVAPEVEDLAGEVPEARAARAEAARLDEVTTPFDLERGPLFRARILRLEEDLHELILTSHHLVCDGWSTAVLLGDLGPLYAARRRGAPPALPPATPFGDFARAVAARDESDAEDWWVARFEDGAPVLDLPVDGPRPRLRTWDSDRVDVALEADLLGALRKVGARRGASLFATLFAGFAAFLHRLTGQEDLVVGVPAAGQVSFPGGDRMVGHAVNLLPVRTRVTRDVPFSEYLLEVRGQVLDAFEHHGVTFGRLLQRLPLERDPSRIPLVPVQLNLDRSLDPSALGFEGLEVSFRSNPRRYENFELFVNAVESGGRLLVECQYNTDLFGRETVEARLAEWRTLLEGAVADPDAPVGSLPLLPAGEREQVLCTWNATETPTPEDPRVHALFEAAAARSPDAVAVVAGGETLTYADLRGRARRLARHLRGLGVGPGDRIALSVGRGADMVAAALGIQLSGAAYVPLDPAYPAERVAYMLEHSGARVLVTETSLRDGLPDVAPESVLLDADRATLDALPDGPVDGGAGPDDPAYVIYTSGSTGRPKGVVVPHRGVAGFLADMARSPGLGSGDVLVAVTTLSFDISVLELMGPLAAGGRVVVADEEQAADGRALAALLERSGATVMQATPATWRMLVESGWRGRPGFRALCGGEAFPRDLVGPLLERAGEVWNLYGPTETTIWSTRQRVTSPDGPVPIGRPIANTRAYVLDEAMQPVPVGVPGELWLGGVGVARGYLHDEAQTAERFVRDPFSERPGARLYRTGDVARWRRDGVLLFERRIDTQVKVRGFRIELGEIEAVLASHPGVRRAVASVWEPRPGDVRLVGYYVPDGEGAVDAADLREHLGRSLPPYMVPQHLVPVAVIPRTPNGKADRKALPEPEVGGVGRAGHVPPRTETERALAEVWREVLHVERVGAHDDFFALGGHSILATRVVALVEDRLGVELPLRRVFASPTLSGLGEHVDALRMTRRAAEAVEASEDDGEREEVVF